MRRPASLASQPSSPVERVVEVQPRPVPGQRPVQPLVLRGRRVDQLGELVEGVQRWQQLGGHPPLRGERQLFACSFQVALEQRHRQLLEWLGETREVSASWLRVGPPWAPFAAPLPEPQGVGGAVQLQVWVEQLLDCVAAC